MNQNLLLGVNIDHIATIRQARGTGYPDPVQAAMTAEQAGADGITLHLREDRRHIQPRDVRIIKSVLQTRMNLELAITDNMLQFAEDIKPEHVCFVPEKREELTTEGGLDVCEYYKVVKEATKRMKRVGAEVSLFIDASEQQINAAVGAEAQAVEIHTGQYADAETENERNAALTTIIVAVEYALSKGLIVNAGHGLNYHNVKPIAAIKGINELNIGHAIIARALFTGLDRAVITMRQLMQESRIHATT